MKHPARIDEPKRAPSPMQAEIARIADIARFVGDDAATALADELIEQLPRGELNLLVVGQFKRGKSTLVNALLGADVMPTGALPITGVVTTIRYGSERTITIGLRGRGLQSILPAELALYVSEHHNPGNRLKVERVDVQWPSERIGGFAIFDTPGVGSTFEHNTCAAYSALPRADAAILVVGPEPPIGASEVQYAHSVLASSERLFIVLNKSDLAGPDLPSILEFTRNAVSQAFPPNASVDIIPLSATRARERQREGLEDAAFADFVAQLQRFARDQGESTRRRSARRRATSLIQRLDILLAMGWAAVNLPLAERNRRRQLVEQALQSLEDRVRPLLLSVDDDVKQLVFEVQAGLDRCYESERFSLDGLSQKLSSEASSQSRSKQLEKLIESKAHVWRDEAVRTASLRLHECAIKYGRLLGELEAAALRAGCDALHIDPRALEPHEIEFASATLQLATSLQPTTGLELAVAFLIDLIPMPFRQPILKRRIKDTLTHELDAVRGKLRFGLGRELDPWRRLVHSTIIESVDQTRQSILNVFRDLSTDGDGTVKSELEQLSTIREELGTITIRLAEQKAS